MIELSCVYWLYLITAHDWRIVDIYAGPTAKAECTAFASAKNAAVQRKPGQIGPTFSCHPRDCGE